MDIDELEPKCVTVNSIDDELWKSDYDYDTDDLESEPEPELYSTNPVWTAASRSMRSIPFDRKSGLLESIRGIPIDYFNMLVDDALLESIVRLTNRHATKILCEANTGANPPSIRWKELTVPELNIFIALLLHMGTIRIERMEDYWKTDPLFGLTCFTNNMSRDRFRTVLRFLCFSSDSTDIDDPLHKVRSLVEYFNNKMTSVYYPQKYLSLDEGLVVKISPPVDDDVSGGRAARLCLLKETDCTVLRCLLSPRGQPAADIVLRLMQGKLGYGHALYLHEKFTSVTLATILLGLKTYCTGKLRPDRPHIPQEIQSTVLERGETIARYSNGVMVGRWNGAKEETYISTEFYNTMLTVINKRKESLYKPAAIAQYNAVNACAVPINYPSDNNTLTWDKKIFLFILELVLTNSFILYNKYAKDVGCAKLAVYDFRLTIIRALLPPLKPSAIKLQIRKPEHTPSKHITQDKTNTTKRKRCRVCMNKGKRKESIYVCKGCPGQPGLCVVNCFDEFHRSTMF